MNTPEVTKLSEHNGFGDTALASDGVNNAQALKAAPVWSVISGKDSDRLGMTQMLSIVT